MRRLALILCCLAIPAQAAEDALQLCLVKVRQQAEKKLNLQKSCPALFNELQSQKLLTAFEPPLLAEISLAQLEWLADSRHTLRKPSSIRQNGLDQLLANILETELKDPESEWWQAFLKWLDSLKAEDYEAEYQWLLRFIETIKPSKQSVLFFIYGSMALLVITSAWLVLGELYRAGVFAFVTGRRRPIAECKQRHEKISSSSATQQAINELPPHRQITVLLEQVIDVLAERKMIPRDTSLTHRQLLRYIGLHAAGPESIFAHLVQEAEPIVYGNRPVTDQVLEHYRRDVQTLLSRPVL